MRKGSRKAQVIVVQKITKNGIHAVLGFNFITTNPCMQINSFTENAFYNSIDEVIERALEIAKNNNYNIKSYNAFGGKIFDIAFTDGNDPSLRKFVYHIRRINNET